MSSVQHLSELINERLTAAAKDVLTQFERTIVLYKEEIDRRNRLLDQLIWKQQTASHTTDLPQQHVHEENVFAKQSLCNQERNSILVPEPPQMKEEQEELCTSQAGEQLVLMQEADMLAQCKSKCEELSRGIFGLLEKTLSQFDEEIDRQRRLLDIIRRPQLKLHRIDLPQQHVCKEEKDLTDQQLCYQERNFNLDQTTQYRGPSQIKEEQKELCTSLDQKDPGPPQIKEEHQELSTSQQGEQIVLTQATDTCLMTATDEDSDHSELEPNSDQLLSYDSPIADSPHQEGGKHVDSESTRNAELKPKKSRNRNSSYSNNVDNASLSESHCDTDTGRKSITCDVCGNTFKNKYEIKKHDQIQKGGKPNACNACGKSFNLSQKVYSCERCGKTFSQSGDLTAHMKTHTDDKLSCTTCGKSFTKSNTLIVHMRTHTGEKPYSCKTCKKSFTQRNGLLTHMRTHTGQKPYSCETCGKRFTQRTGWFFHMRTHTGQKPYSCDRCGKRYSQRGNLTVHMRTHTGEKPYVCEICGKSYSQSGNLTIHKRTHTGEKPYFCKTCGNSYSQSSNLAAHMRVHTGWKLYPCKKCGRTFQDRDVTKRHMKRCSVIPTIPKRKRKRHRSRINWDLQI